MLKADRKNPLPRMHLSGHDQNNTYCNSWSLFSEKTDYVQFANCRTCIALYNKDMGIEKVYPFSRKAKEKIK